MLRNGRCALLLALAAAAGCSRHPATTEKRFPLRGEVVSLDTAHHTVRVTHQAVPGLMPGMTMDFPVRVGDEMTLHAGEQIKADLVIDRVGAAPRLENIWPDDPSAAAAVAAGASALREDTHDRGDSAYREVGEVAPDFTLFDQAGRVVNSGRFRGKQVMLNFIYSRCPDPNMCPAATARMIATQHLAKQAGVKNIEFVSITLDPVNDTPGVLAEYAHYRGIDTSNYSFLTGPEGAVRDLLTQFGVIADFSDGIVKHTLATLLINASGKIVWRADGSQWDPQDFVARMRKT
ncbi:MAG TPA: SCO family protein [Opitutaceae bacterium]|jgi:protein SCO1/2